MSLDEKIALSKSKDIDKRLKEDGLQNQRDIKLLLLGTWL